MSHGEFATLVWAEFADPKREVIKKCAAHFSANSVQIRVVNSPF